MVTTTPVRKVLHGLGPVPKPCKTLHELGTGPEPELGTGPEPCIILRFGREVASSWLLGLGRRQRLRLLPGR